MLGWAITFDNRIDSSSIWIWRHRRSFGGHCQILIRALLGYVRNLFFPWTERKRSAVIANRLHGVERLLPLFSFPLYPRARGVGTNSGSGSTVAGNQLFGAGS